VAGLPEVAHGASHRTRRWDAVVVGSALPGLLAGVRLAQHGWRVLLVEEHAARELPSALREPFFVPSPEAEGVLGSLLRAIQIPLIDLRRIGADPLALQVLRPEARVDLGTPARTAAELVAWGLCKPDDARALVRGLLEAAKAEREALLAAPFVKPPRRRFGGVRARAIAAPGQRPARGAPRHERGLPEAVTGAPPELARVLDDAVRALAHTAEAAPGPEARARLLGSLLLGAAVFPGAPAGLREHLRRRFESLHGETRSVEGPFQLVDANGQPGVALLETGEIWAGRVLLLNAPRAALARAVDGRAPACLRGPEPTHVRVPVHVRVPTGVLPEGMAPRVSLVALREDGSALPLRLRVSGGGPTHDADLFATAVVRDTEEDRAAVAPAVEAALGALMPFSEGRLLRRGLREPRWDRESLLADPPPGAAWPAEIEIRALSRPPVFALDRVAVAALGLEGELLLGWRAGDAIAAEL